jgi:mannose-6-phosphate isomerase-like protein (cupin superfamily)
MQLGDKRFDVKKDDIILIPARKFHKVFNTGKEDLVYICIFEKYEGRGK